MMDKLPFGFYETANPEVRVYLSRAVLTELEAETVSRNGHFLTKLFGDIVQTPGVSMLIGKPYEIMVRKADLYAWEEVHPRVLDYMIAANVTAMPPASDLKQ
jgi:hypothetical protein